MYTYIYLNNYADNIIKKKAPLNKILVSVLIEAITVCFKLHNTLYFGFSSWKARNCVRLVYLFTDYLKEKKKNNSLLPRPYQKGFQ